MPSYAKTAPKDLPLFFLPNNNLPKCFTLDVPAETNLEINYEFPDLVILDKGHNPDYPRRRLQGINGLNNKANPSDYEHGMDAMWNRRHGGHHQDTTSKSRERQRPPDHPHDRLWERNRRDSQLEFLMSRAGANGRKVLDTVIYGKSQQAWKSEAELEMSSDILVHVYQEPFKEMEGFANQDHQHLPNGGRLGEMKEVIRNERGVLYYTVPFTAKLNICVQSSLASEARPCRAGLFVEKARDLKEIFDNDQAKRVKLELSLVSQRIKMAQNLINDILQEIHLSKEQQSEFFRNSNALHQDLVKFPIIHITMLITTAILQTIYIIRYLQKRHIIS